MSECIRILYVNGGLMDRGGVSSVMMNYYLRFNPEYITVDFLVHGSTEGDRDQEIKKNGGKIYRVPPKSKNPFLNYYLINKIMKDGKYDIVHAHADSGNAYILKIAKSNGVKIRISHSHNTGFTINNKLRIFLNNIQKKNIKKYATHKWACSEKAGIWLYGKNETFDVVPNAIEVSKFAFDVSVREKIREEYGLTNKTVIGHVGRFDYQKNQLFLLEAFSLAVKENKSIHLVLVGDGVDRNKIEKKITDLKIVENVTLLGKRSDVYAVMNMFDIFAFPSRFEGLGVVVIEALANGLPCICSTEVPRDTNITGSVQYLPLEESVWKKAMQKRYVRDECGIDKIVKCGYEINSAAKRLQNMYMEMVD